MNRVIKKTDGGISSQSGSTPAKKTVQTVEKSVWSPLAFSGFMQQEIANWSRKFTAERAATKDEQTKLMEQAFREGYAKGHAEGMRQEREDKIKSIEALLNEAKSKSRKAIIALEYKIVNLAVEIAERIIRKSINASPETVNDMVAEAMTYIIGSESVFLKVSVEDFKVINAKYGNWMNLAGGAAEFKIEIDKRLRTGDFVIETEGGIIDAVVIDRIDVITEELLKTAE